MKSVVITGGWKLNGILSLNFRLLKGLIYTETKCPLKGAPSRGEQRVEKKFRNFLFLFVLENRNQTNQKEYDTYWCIFITAITNQKGKIKIHENEKLNKVMGHE